MQQLREVLCGPSGEQEENWSHRFKANQEKLRLGELLVTAEVVRDLIRRQEERGLSTAEEQMLRYARRLVLAELALSLSLTDEEAEARLDPVVLGTTPVAG